MSLEQRNIQQESAEILPLSGVEERLRQKLYVQQEVMKALGFLPDNFDPASFDSANYELPADKEALALKWSTEVNEKMESNAEIFNRVYAGVVQEFPNSMLPSGELRRVIDRIVAKFVATKDMVSPS